MIEITGDRCILLRPNISIVYPTSFEVIRLNYVNYHIRYKKIRFFTISPCKQLDYYFDQHNHETMGLLEFITRYSLQLPTRS